MSAPQQAGGRTRQAQLREALGESAYRQRQRALARAGGIARQAQLRTALGDADYCAYQHTLYQRAVQKHGSTKMHDVLATAREQRRCSRIANPTPAEALLHWLALEAGFTLHADLAGDFAWAQFRTDPERWCFGPTDALTEARVLGYACDLLLPARSLVIEVVGGVHTLTAERDAARTAALRDQGLRVITFTNEQVYQGKADQFFVELLEVRHAT